MGDITDLEDDSAHNSIAKCRELLGDEAADLSDEQLDAMPQHAPALANVLVEIFLNSDSPSRGNEGKLHFLVVFNLTRFARDPPSPQGCGAPGKYDHFALRSHLKSLGISLWSATEPIDDTSTGKLMEGVLAAFAQFDNDVRSDRTRAGMKEALQRRAAVCRQRPAL